MTIAKTIKMARKQAGLTQEELGAKLGVSGSMLAQYETGRRSPKIETLQRIADALDLSLSDLLEGKIVYHISVRNRDERFDLKSIRIHSDPVPNTTISMSGDPSVNKLVSIFLLLNDKGQKKAIERVKELTEVPKYHRTSTQEDAEQNSKAAPGAANTESGKDDTDH